MGIKFRRASDQQGAIVLVLGAVAIVVIVIILWMI